MIPDDKTQFFFLVLCRTGRAQREGEMVVVPAAPACAYSDPARHTSGEIIESSDGVEVAPSGEELRQIVHDSEHGEVRWHNSTWISRNGSAYQRIFDPTDRGEWELRGPKSLVPGPTGELLVTIGAGSGTRRVRLVRAIALAWVECPECLADGGTWHAKMIEEGPLDASRVGWVAARRTGPTPLAAPLAAPPPPDEEFFPLRYEWMAVGGEVQESFSPQIYGAYQISRNGWLRSPHSGVQTRGIRCPSGRRWAPIAGAGFVWLDRAVLYSFAGAPRGRARAAHRGRVDDNALRNLFWVPIETRETERATTELLRLHIEAGASADEICSSCGMSRSAMWQRLAIAATEHPWTQLRWLRRLVAPRVVAMLETLPRHLPLAELYDHVDETERWADWWRSLHREDQYGMLRLAQEMHLRRAWRRRRAEEENAAEAVEESVVDHVDLLGAP